MHNQEVGMRVVTDIDSGEDFYTDLNGFSMMRRKRRAKLPLQANYYPVPSMAYIQDGNRYRIFIFISRSCLFTKKNRTESDQLWRTASQICIYTAPPL